MRRKQCVGRLLATGEPCTVTVDDGRVEAVQSVETVPDDAPWIAPGLFDLQVNGFGGHNLNGPDPSPEEACAVAACLRARGVTSFCPTIVTDSLEAMCGRLEAVARACREDAALARAAPCVHIEGPFLSPEDGPRGAHPAEHVRPASEAEFGRLQRAAEGRIGLVTLAPEVPGALELARELCSAGILVAIGHTAAAPEAIREAIAAGARLSTHLGNGAHAALPRHPNYIWEQLADDRLWASLIPDGHHLPPSVVKCMVRAKGLERTVLVSDAVDLAGLPPGAYEFLGRPVEMLPSGRINLAGTPYLAGSSLCLLEGVWNAAQFAGIPLGQAWQMASENPWRVLGQGGRRAVREGGLADIVLLRLPPQGPPEVVEVVG